MRVVRILVIPAGLLVIPTVVVVVVGVFLLDVRLGENTLLSGPEVLAHPPVGIHILVDGQSVVPLETAIARVGRCVGVQGLGVGNDGFGWRRWGRRGGLFATGQGRGAAARGLGV